MKIANLFVSLVSVSYALASFVLSNAITLTEGMTTESTNISASNISASNISASNISASNISEIGFCDELVEIIRRPKIMNSIIWSSPIVTFEDTSWLRNGIWNNNIPVL